MAVKKKINYLNNKDILKEIHKSKMSFCTISNDEAFLFDLIIDSTIGPVTDMVEMTFEEIEAAILDPETILAAKSAQAKRHQSEAYAAAMVTHNDKDYRNKPL